MSYFFCRATRVGLTSFNFHSWRTKYVGASWSMFGTSFQPGHLQLLEAYPLHLHNPCITIRVELYRMNGLHRKSPVVLESREELQQRVVHVQTHRGT